MLMILQTGFIYSQALNGSYSINSNGSGDYTSFSSAVADLITYGINGPVVFLVEPGLYNEQISIPAITGSSSVNTISFIGNVTDSLSVQLQYSQSSFAANYVVQLDGADYISFFRLTIQSTGLFYSRVFELKNEAEHNQISACHLVGPPVAYNYDDNAVVFSGNTRDHYNTVVGNSILNGSYGVLFLSTTSINEYGNSVQNNFIKGFYYQGVRADYQYDIHVNNNYIESDSLCYSYLYGIYLKHPEGPSSINNNNVQLHGSNYIQGIRADFSNGTPSNPVIISNNFIAQTGFNNDVVRAMMIYHGSDIGIYYNTIHVSGGNGNNSRAMYLTTYGSSSTGNVRIKNNNLVNSGGGLAMYMSYDAVYDNMVSECDYNNFYSSGSNFAYYSTSQINSISDWQSNSGWGSHSINVDPVFVSMSDLHVNNLALNATGNPVNGINFDIDGDVRDSLQPDIGADEFGLPGPMHGDYTIDLSGNGDFTSFAGALSQMYILGVDSAVRFHVAPGTYNEKLHILEIPGASAQNRITFWSGLNDSTSVILTNSISASSAENYTLYLDGADYITFGGMTIKTDVPWTYCTVIRLDNGALSNQFLFCRILGVSYNSYNTNFAVVYSNGGNDNACEFNNNYVSGGSYGFYLKGSSQYNPESGVMLSGNRVENFSARGILVHFHNHVEVSKNTIISNPEPDTYNYVYGIYSGFCDQGSVLSNNAIEISGYDKNYGLYLNYCDGDSAQPNRYFNNMIVISGNSTATNYGLFSFSGSYQTIAYNSVQVNAGGSSSNAASVSALSSNQIGHIELYNNVFSNGSGGKAISVNTTAISQFSITNSDYNCFSFTGSVLGQLGNFSPASLSEWQLMSSWDGHSFQGNPGFVSGSDLHLVNSSTLIGTGMPIASITADIDGDLRSLTTPCIGADELYIQIDSQIVDLNSGWDIFSGYIRPFNNSLDSVFAPVISHILLMKDGDGLVFWPPFVNQIDSFTIGEGYQIKCDSLTSLEWIGTAVVPENEPISLSPGWSIIGYLRNSSGPLSTLLAPIIPSIDIMKDANGLVFWPQYSLDLIGTLYPGEGYQIKMLNAATFTYPPN